MRQRIIVSVDKTSITFRLEGESEDSPLHYSETSLFLAWVRRHNASLLSSTFISVDKRISDQETGLRLRQARLAANLSQVELAQRANISRSAIALWETGRKGCSLKRLTQIAHALDLDIVDLISSVEKDPRKSEEHYLLSLFRKVDECSRHEILRWLSTRVR
ncbi:helix-turn-helix domain-containing protein [Acetobacter estunensis]|nr:helix-turn-helix transcriptional regulator [Acetobacter estunensis]